ncbi:MAG: oligosaccharide flippase family protein [Rubrivivax sp.]
MSDTRRWGASVFWSVSSTGAGQLLSLLVFFVTARYVSAAEFGQMAICLLCIELFRNVAIEGFAVAVTSRPQPQAKDFDDCFVAILLVSVASAGAAVAAAPLVASVFGNEQLTGLLRWMSLLLLTTGLSRAHEAWLARHFKFRTLALRSTLAVAVGGAAGIVLAMRGHGVVALVVQQLVTALVATLILWAGSAWVPRWRSDRASFMELWRYARHVALTGLTNFLNTQSDVAFAAYYLDAAATGTYHVAKRMLTAINNIIGAALNRVALPAFAELRHDPVRMRAAFLKAVALTSSLTAPLFAGLIVLSPEAVRVALGPRWSESATLLSLIAATAYLNTIGQYNHAVMLVSNKPHWQTALTAVYALSNVLLFALVVRFGLVALAIGFTARAVLLYPLSVGAALRLLQLRARDYLAQLLPTLAAAAAMGLLLHAASRHLPVQTAHLRLLVLAGLGAALYLLAMLLLARRELRLLRQVAGELLARRQVLRR